jgi:signal transduction histidine kinase
VNLIRPQAQKRGIVLRLTVARGLPEIETDARKFQQVLFNFLSNAVKFTPPGGEVEVTAALGPTAKADGGQRVRVSVRDTGPGIPPERRMEVFEKFQQLDTGVAREHEGTGLGLAIAWELTRLIGGEIELESELGRGSTFSLVVPVRLEAAGAEPASEPASESALAGGGESGSMDRPAA